MGTKGYSVYMNTLRNTTSWIFLYLVGPIFFLMALTFAFFSVVNPNTIKGALKDENVYTNVVPSVLKTTATTNVSTAQIPLKEPWVQTAAEKAFPPADLEQKTNTAIDSTFAWLNGTTDQPEFSIDLTSNKEAFSQEVGNYAQTRYEGLPACSRANIPSTTDPLTVTCRIPGMSSSSAANTLMQRVQNDKDFLPNTVITPNNASLNPVNKTADTGIFDNLEGLRAIYQQKTLLMWVLPLLTVVLTAGGLFLAKDRVKGTRQLMRAFLITGVGLLILGFIVGTGLGKVIDTLAIDAVTSNVIEPVITNLGSHAQRVYFIFGAVAIIAAIASYAAGRMLKNIQKAQRPQFDRPPFDQNQPRV